jgi:sec-independent protein translocase protein TatC
MSENNDTFWGHASELRRVLVRAAIVVVLGMCCTLFFYQELFSVLTSPLQKVAESRLPTALNQQEIKRIRIFNSGMEERFYMLASDARTSAFSIGVREVEPDRFLIPSGGYLELDQFISQKEELIILGPVDGMLASLKISFLVSLIGTSPIWLFMLLQFLAPALHVQERRLVLPFLVLSYGFLAAGCLFAFFVTIPLANKYFALFNEGIGVNFWTLNHYIDYTVALLISGALVFELGVVLLFLVHFGVLTAEVLQNKRRHAIVAAFIIGAVLTPPDVLTQLMLAIPLIVLYEASILYARLRAYSVSSNLNHKKESEDIISKEF